VNEVGLDRSAAALFYRAERLQEKGQIKQSIKYFEVVLSRYPDCFEASENLRIVRELLEDGTETSRPRMDISLEKKEVKQHQQVITEMEVNWSVREDIRLDFYAFADECAVHAAETKLKSIGYGRSCLKMISHKTTKQTCSSGTVYETAIAGRAIFQVTLIPKHASYAQPEPEKLILQQMIDANEAASSLDDKGSTIEQSDKPIRVSEGLKVKTRKADKAEENSSLHDAQFGDANEESDRDICLQTSCLMGKNWTRSF
jgi:hypothetical protein